MGTWNTSWQLTMGSTPKYEKFAVGKFKLKKVNKGAAYKVENASSARPTRWRGATFVPHTGIPGPELGWPLMNNPQKEHAENAGDWIKEMAKKHWGKPGVEFEYLEGQVPVDNGMETIVLFKSAKGMKNGKDFLVGIRKVELDQGQLPDGSVSGRRV